MSDEENEESGFVIKDKRSAYQSDDEIQEGDTEQEKETAKQQQQEARAAEQQEGQQPSIDFSTFVMSLASSAFYHLGDMPDPTTGQTEQNLPAVQQTIEILVMLHQKTKSNLTAEEDKLLGQLIYELQMKFVAKNKQ
ncbi:MAG: DUF1844 domain-containing protein [Candidatus Nitronauta litoralis]|uniref:DUF1844 domain-containing protein n=1 Tax=Candidatus Nitronauta litoralis TaxID=2705533 RepID=A0A7T0BXF8_9BACT|nr:MAG: DUF1844 domain-containing protein [Candidatus Nitronauta litoralis]